MRFLIFSDIHGNQYAWRTFLKYTQNIKYDYMVFLGDIFGYYYGQAEIIDGLSSIERLIWLKGNHDQFFLDMMDNKISYLDLESNYGSTYRRIYQNGEWMRKLVKPLSFSCQLQVDSLNIFFCHGTPKDPLNGRCYPRDNWKSTDCQNYDIIIAGHTHFRMIQKGGGKLWLNVGSLGQPRDGKESCCLLFDTKEQKFEYVDLLYEKTFLFQEVAEKDPNLHKLKDIWERKNI